MIYNPFQEVIGLSTNGVLHVIARAYKGRIIPHQIVTPLPERETKIFNRGTIEQNFKNYLRSRERSIIPKELAYYNKVGNSPGD